MWSNMFLNIYARALRACPPRGPHDQKYKMHLPFYDKALSKPCKVELGHRKLISSKNMGYLNIMYLKGTVS